MKNCCSITVFYLGKTTESLIFANFAPAQNSRKSKLAEKIVNLTVSLITLLCQWSTQYMYTQYRHGAPAAMLMLSTLELTCRSPGDILPEKCSTIIRRLSDLESR